MGRPRVTYAARSPAPLPGTPMVNAMKNARAVLLPLLLVSTALSGCFGGDSEPAEAPSPTPTTTEDATPSPTEFTSTPRTSPPATNTSTASPSPSASPSPNTTSPSPSPPPNQTALIVTIRNYTTHLNVSDMVKVEWRVDVYPNRTLRINHTEVHWAAHRVADPKGPADYGNGSGAKESPTVPATFSTSFRLPRGGSYFFRAHAVWNQTTWWSEEFEIRVNVTRVEIGPGLQFASFRPSNVTVRLGDGVRWANRDVTAHTATNDTGAPMAFDTGSIAPGADSRVIYFNQTGTYRYHCSIHPSTMKATIMVVP